MFDDPVVCNTGPLIGLARIGLAGLPFNLFPTVHVPQEVVNELLGADSPDATDLKVALSSAKIAPLQENLDPFLATELDLGEAAVIAVARSLGIQGAILDERKRRRIASKVYRLKVKGSAGLLVAAKRRGLVKDVKPLLEGMIAGGYYIGSAIVEACLEAAGED